AWTIFSSAGALPLGARAAAGYAVTHAPASNFEFKSRDNICFSASLCDWLHMFVSAFSKRHVVSSAQDNPLQLPLKKCAVVGNGGILRHSKCGRDIDQADFIMRCNLPPLSKEYVEDVGTRTHLVTANPSIIEKRFQNLLWSRKAFVDSMKVYGSSYMYMPAFSMKPGTDPSLRAYYALADTSSNLTMLFANPEFLRTVGKFWKGRGVHAKRLSTGLFLISLALGLCEEVTAYGFWPFSVGLDEQPVSHHYYDNILPYKWFHAMPEEFVQLWHLHKSGTLRMRVGHCPAQAGGS
uniref:Alpha-N-acetylneuraminide alpha-2,8-sialyltransferase n=1 Tax=Acanthochromis polyacanthus TaxID=80966 RepID=A0A3Q1GG31_9TELE